MREKKWTEDQLRVAVASSYSLRQVLKILGLKPAGGNYSQIKKHLVDLGINSSHFKGQGWNKGLTGFAHPRFDLKKILILGSSFQSYKLKKRLFAQNIKKPECEECGWSKHHQMEEFL